MDIVTSLFYGILYVLSILVGKDRWLVLFSLGAFGFGVVWIASPSVILAGLVKDKDALGPIQDYFLRPFGCYRILNAILTFQSWRRGDKIFQSTLMLVTSLAMSKFIIGGHMFTGRFYWGTALWPFAGIFYLTTAKDLHFAGKHGRSSLDKYLRLDALLLFIWGSLWLAYPDSLLKWQINFSSEETSVTPASEISKFQRLFVLNYASYVISSAILSALAPSFRKAADKRLVFALRVALNVAHLVVMIKTRARIPGLFATNGGLVAMAGVVLHTSFCLMGIAASDQAIVDRDKQS